ncbi:phasin family protein [Bacillus massiliigorillae]|uniref:phasin family protein n=1 Tax=Bacillus massiliigorillae TaxID=1243664 RepID=UPI00039B7295|nr:aspartyl beta-hydroxylase [Bacillus massiliigorillae]
MSFNDEMKKVLLAGIGAVATTVEKSQDLVQTLITKGEITVEQGKVLNEELKRNIKDPVKKDKLNTETSLQEESTNLLINQLDNMSEEEIAAIKLKLAEMEK